VSKMWVICLSEGDNPAKAGLIPRNVFVFKDMKIKGWPLFISYREEMSPHPITLVGGVMAHQGDDG
jgi:hypothetical protein